ncbi:protoporphyrinogen oxidase [Alkalihalobacillus macyae]|uniref:protoporphyrinogen oxidase n=1 Tax=Guptibacillus hwajinpoensis TaxID=208199 RepID=UPI00273C721D|nr:protoporphyrinogen oxidase [Alkalihalobacillus macyae]MDP4551755.1 protoporphyrinogen oxidase [Alkalihalobacillus macyae]
MNKQTKRIVIVGGGITGLTAAYYLQKEMRELDVQYEITLLEGNDKLGGKIQTDTTNGYVIERGPDSFLARKESAARLVKEVGLENQLVPNSTGQAFVLNNDQLYPIPGGAVMGIPTELSPFVSTQLFSLKGKVRAACDLILPRREDDGKDQSLGLFFRRRLGNEVVENLIEPLLSGIYAGDIDKLSLMSTFPQFYEVERKYRSLIIGMKKTTPPSRRSTGKKKPAFLTVKSGLQSFIKAIEDRLTDVEIKKNVKVDHLTREKDSYILTTTNGDEMLADAVIVTTPHQQVHHMLRDQKEVAPLEEMPSTTVATVAMAFPEEAVKKAMDGTGFVVSRNADYTITACTWTHRKWQHAAPKGKVLLRCYVGRAGKEEIVEKSDEEIVQTVLNDLNQIMEIEGHPEFYRITRWRQSMPQYEVGHRNRIDLVKEGIEAKMPGVFLAGASYNGVGLPDCIDQGEASVTSVLDFLQ